MSKIDEKTADACADFLAAWDERFAVGDRPSAADSAVAAPELQPPLIEGLDVLRLLNELRPNHNPEDSGPNGPLKPGERFGRFLVRSELGHGGFATVFLAFDPRLGREVAIKVPHPGSLFTPELRERFHNEGLAAASLDHPNIVQVFEADEIGPNCYIASAYCAGGNLAQWLHERNAPMPVKLAADWIRQIALGIQHAHDRGVVHRDLKPANVLLQIEATRGSSSEKLSSGTESQISNRQSAIPKVADFGLAKIIETDSGLTRTGAVVGTPNYMAPEQAAGRLADVGPAADVYALGAILYELLAGRPPFVAESAVETLQLIRFEEPVAPRRLRPSLPRDLETICLKCLQKEPARRYGTSAALAEDLRRFDAGEAITARPISSFEKTLRWGRRNPTIAALMVTLVISVVGGIAGIATQLQRANSLAIKNGQERDKAVANYQRARAAVERMSKLGNEIANRPGLDRARHAVYEEVLQYCLDFLTENTGDPAMRSDTAHAWRQVGRLRFHFGKFKEADEAFTQEGKLLDGLIAEEPDNNRYRFERAQCLVQHGHALRNLVENDKANAAYKTAIEICRALAAKDPDENWYKILQAAALMNVASCYSDTTAPEAESALLQALDLFRPLAGKLANDPAFLQNYFIATADLGLMRSAQGRFDEAEAACKDALAMATRLAEKWPNQPANLSYLARAHRRLVDVYVAAERIAEAEPIARAGFAPLRKLIADYPDNYEYRRAMVDAHGKLGQILLMQQRAEDALATTIEALAIQKSLANTFAENPTVKFDLAHAHCDLGIVYSDLGRWAESIAAFRASLADAPDDAVANGCLARVLALRADPLLRNPVEAIKLADAATRAAPNNGDFWTTLGIAQFYSSDAEHALTTLEKAVALHRDAEPLDWVFLALTHAKLNAQDKARENLTKAAKWLHKHPNADPILRAVYKDADAVVNRSTQ